MSTSREFTKHNLREAVKSFGHNGAQFGYALVYETFGLVDAPDMKKHAVRTRINEMVRSGELLRVAEGVFTYNPKYRLSGDSPFRKRIWKFVRNNKPGWTLKEASLLTGVSYTHVMKYCDWLEQENYIESIGKKGTARTFRATSLADKSPEMPQPPTQENNPFEKEARAAGKIANLMLYGNPYMPKTAKEIANACKVLLARFDKPFNQNENAGETV